MKSFKKVLATTLAAAMVITAVPVSSANAAAQPKLSATKKTYYAGKSYKLKVTTPSSWKSVKVTSKSSKKSVATVKTSKKTITVKAVKAGKSTVTVKVTGKNKKGKKLSKTLKCAVTVKTSSVTLNQKEAALAIGETVKLTAKTTPASIGSSVAFTTSDEKIATVANDGTVTAIAEGTATVTATAKCGSETVKAETKVTVKKYDFKEVKQTALKKIETVIAGKTSDLKVADVAVKNTTTKSDVLVKSVTPDKTDATKVVIETYVDMTNGDEIEVTIAGTAKTFKATDGKVTALTVDPVEIPYAALTKIEAVSKDAQGVELNRFEYGNNASGYTFTIDAGTNGYTSGAELYLNKKGDTAKATVTYNTGSYDENGKPVTVEAKDIVITAVDPEVIGTGDIKLRISSESGKKFDDLKDDGKLAKGDDSKYAAIKIMDSKGKEISNYGDYSVETSNKDILIINGSLSGSTADITLTPVAEGNAALIVKKDNKTVAALPIAVLAERKVAKIEIDKNSFTLSTDAAAPSEKVKLTVTDQYGEKMDKSKFESEVKADQLGGAALTTAVVAKDHADEFTFSAAGVSGIDVGKTAKYTYKVCVGDFVRVVTITVAAPDTSKDAKLNINLSASTMDAVVKSSDDTAKTITVGVENLYNGIFGGYGLSDNVKVKLYKGNDEVTKLDGNGGSINAVTSTSTGASINVTGINAGVTYKLAAGTYTVKVIDSDNKVLSSKSFSVTDSQDKVTAVRDNAECKFAVGDTTNEVNAVAKCFKFTCGNKTSKADNTGDIQVLSVAFNNGQSFGNGDKSIKEAVVKVQVDTGVWVAVTVTLNQTITISGVV